MSAPQSPQPKLEGSKPKRVLVAFRTEPQVIAALDKLVELGYFKDRTEAINHAIQRLLHDVFFIAQATRLASKKTGRGKMPTYTLNEIFRYLSEASALQTILDDFSVFVTPTFVAFVHKRRDFEELYALLKNILENPDNKEEDRRELDESAPQSPHAEPPQSELNNSEEGSP